VRQASIHGQARCGSSSIPRRRRLSISSCAFQAGRKARPRPSMASPIALMATNGYATTPRVWRKGDAVSFDLKMPAERFYAHPNVRMDVGLAALRRGPLIYCVEEAGIPAGRCRPCRCRAQRRSRPREEARSWGASRRALLDRAARCPGRRLPPCLSSVGQSNARLDAGVGGRGCGLMRRAARPAYKGFGRS
jgi:hypothetical protein